MKCGIEYTPTFKPILLAIGGLSNGMCSEYYFKLGDTVIWNGRQIFFLTFNQIVKIMIRQRLLNLLFIIISLSNSEMQQQYLDLVDLTTSFILMHFIYLQPIRCTFTPGYYSCGALINLVT